MSIKLIEEFNKQIQLKGVFIQKFIVKLLILCLIILLFIVPGCNLNGNENSEQITGSNTESTDNEGNESVSTKTEENADIKDPGDIDEDNKDNIIAKEENENSNIVASVKTEAPELKLEIIEGPEYEQDGSICYYRVRAIVTGEPDPGIYFNRDDSSSAWGLDVAQVNLSRGESFTLNCEVKNIEGSASDSITLKWIDSPGQQGSGDAGDSGNSNINTGDNSSISNSQEVLLSESDVDFNKPSDFNIEVNLTQQKVYIYYKDETLKIMPCSGGTTEKPTPLGKFKTNEKIKYAYVAKYQMGAYYWTRFYGEYLFHSIPYDAQGNILTEELEKIGTPASHGCIRLYVEDAKWMYDKLPLGIGVDIHY